MKKFISFLFVLFIAGNLFSQTDVLPPVLVSPDDGDDNQPADVAMNWYAASGVGSISYELQYDSDSLFGNPVSITTEFTSAQGSMLFFATTYYWRVRTIDNTGTSVWSEVFNFYTFEQIELKDPGDGDTAIMPQMEIKWKTKYSSDYISGITYYDYQVAYDTGFNDLFKEGSVAWIETSSDEKAQINSLSFDTVYYWRVRARHDMDETIWSEYWSFTSVDKVTNELPEDGATHQMLDVTIQWADMEGTYEYIYELCDDPNFSSPCIFFTDENSVTAMGLMFGTMYYWRVKAAHNTDTTAWSDTWSFETMNNINLVGPENGSYVDDMFPTFEWEEITGVEGFVLLYDKDPNFGDPVADTIEPDQTTHKVVFALEMDEIYHWKMKAFEGGDTTDYSDVWSFTVGVSGIDDMFSDRTVKLYPNPANADLNLEVNLQKQAAVEVSVLNLLGQAVINYRFTMDQGINVNRMDLRNLENGLYIVRLQAGEDTFMKKLVIEK